jgi:hypothetical protein
MAIFFDAPVEPDALTTFVREVPVNRTGQTRRCSTCSARRTSTTTGRLRRDHRTNRTARFRSWDGRIHVSDRDTGSEKRVKLPPLSSSLNMGEYERLQLEFARTGGTNEQALARVDLQRRDEPDQRGAEPDGARVGRPAHRRQAHHHGERGRARGRLRRARRHQLVTVGTPWTTTATAPALSDLLACGRPLRRAATASPARCSPACGSSG